MERYLFFLPSYFSRTLVGWLSIVLKRTPRPSQCGLVYMNVRMTTGFFARDRPLKHSCSSVPTSFFFFFFFYVRYLFFCFSCSQPPLIEPSLFPSPPVSSQPFSLLLHVRSSPTGRRIDMLMMMMLNKFCLFGCAAGPTTIAVQLPPLSTKSDNNEKTTQWFEYRQSQHEFFPVLLSSIVSPWKMGMN